jgi:multidrug efflux system outer membrane protein
MTLDNFAPVRLVSRPKALNQAMAMAMLCTALSSCSLVPEYQRPSLPLSPETQKVLIEPADTAKKPDASLQSGVSSLPDWQHVVQDQQARALISQVLTHNTDLRQALLNVAAAKAQFGVQQAERWPHLQLQANGQRQSLPADLAGASERQFSKSWQAGVGISAFELDLFGRVQSLTDSALQQYLAVEANSKAVQLSQIAELLTQYISFQSMQHQLNLARYTWQSRTQALELVRKKRQLGAADILEYQDAVGLTETAKAEMQVLNRQLAQIRHSLQLLAGRADITPYLKLIPLQPEDLLTPLPAALSSELLLQRPDIMAAEYQLQARHAEIGAARAAFFPRISLTGLIGTASTDLADLFGQDQRSWSFNPQLTLPIFDAGSRQANLTLAELRKDVAVAAYERQIQLAFREVSDSLSALEHLQPELNARQAYVQTAVTTRNLVQKRYQAGLDSQLRYLDAERQVYSAQQALLQTQEQQLLAQVALYKALGGGESPTAPQ